MKKLIVCFMVVLLAALAVTGCNGGNEGTTPDDKEFILIGRVNPTTGPLAAFGDGTPWIEQMVVDYVNEQGGIYIEELDRKLPLKLVILDSESSPDKAAEMATRLILNEKVDILLSMHTPDTTIPCAQMAEKYQIPNVSVEAPADAWLSGGPYTWSYHAFWDTEMSTDLFERMWRPFKDQLGGEPVVALLGPDDPDGVAQAEWFNKILPDRGYGISDVGRFPYFLDDFGSFIRTWNNDGANILTGVVIPPDFTTLWRQLHRENAVPKIATVAKALLFPADVEALAGDTDIAHGLTTEVWWSPYHPFVSELTGETAQGLCDKWSAHTGKQWSQVIGFKYAGMEIVVDVLTRAASLDKNKILQAMEETDVTTLVGHINYGPDHVSRTPLVGGQWVKGEEWPWELNIVFNEDLPEVPITAPMFLIGE